MVICGRADITFRADLSGAASRWLRCSPHPRRGERRRFRRGNQKGRHLRFLPSWDSRFPLFPNLVQTRDRRPLRNRGTAEDFSTVGEHSVLPCPNRYAVPDSILLHRRFSFRRRGIAVPHNSLVWILRTAPTNLSVWCYLSSQVPCVTTC